MNKFFISKKWFEKMWKNNQTIDLSVFHDKKEKNISCLSFKTFSLFRTMESMHCVYRGKDCMKTFCESLREHAMKITNIKKKKTKLLTKE